MSSVVISGDTSGSITLSAPAVSGTNTITLPASTGTVMVNGPAFSTYLATNQTGISTGTFTKVLFDTEIFDTNNNFASSRFTPTVAGYYQVNSCLNVGGTITGSLISIFKNGNRFIDGTFFNAVSLNVITVSGLVYCNGSTDYIEIYGYLTGTGLQFSGSSVGTVFNGSMVRSA